MKTPTIPGLKVFIHGQLEGEIKTTGEITRAQGGDLLAGLSHAGTFPFRTERPYSASFKSPTLIDGLSDEVKIHNRALTEAEVAQPHRLLARHELQLLCERERPLGRRPKPRGHQCRKGLLRAHVRQEVRILDGKDSGEQRRQGDE